MLSSTLKKSHIWSVIYKAIINKNNNNEYFEINTDIFNSLITIPLINYLGIKSLQKIILFKSFLTLLTISSNFIIHDSYQAINQVG